MKLRTAVKRQARLALNGNRGPAVLLLLLIGLVNLCVHLLDSAVFVLMGYRFELYYFASLFYSDSFFFSLPAILYSVASLFIRMALVVPLLYGMVNWHLELTDRRRQGVFYLFWPYEGRTFWRCISATVNLFVRVLLAAAVLLAIPVGLMVFAQLQPKDTVLTRTLFDIGAALTLPAALTLWWFTRRYQLAPMLLGEKYRLTAGRAIRESVRLTRGRGWELMLLDLSFLPWKLPLLGVMALLGATVFRGYRHAAYSLLPGFLTLLLVVVGVLTVLWLVPYYTMTVVMYGRYLYESDAPTPAPAEPQKPATTVTWQPLEDKASPVVAAPPTPQATAAEEPVHWHDL